MDGGSQDGSDAELALVLSGGGCVDGGGVNAIRNF